MEVSTVLVLWLAVFFGSTITSGSITFPEATADNFVAAETLQPVNHENASLRETAHHVANLGLKSLRDLLVGSSNVIISPLNVYSCLGILDQAATGETKEELRRVLGPPPEGHAVSDIIRSNEGVSYASALFLDHGFVLKPECVDAVKAEFQATVRNLNVSDGEQAKEAINSWVSEHTNGTIAELIKGRLDPDTRMVVVSALLFKGKWLHAFPTAATAPGKFETEEGVFVDVPFMHLLASVPLVRNPHFDAVSLPYIDSHGMTMHVILPKAPGVSALKSLLSHLNSNSLKKLRKEAFNEEIFIVVPKMKIEARFSLSNSLKKQQISAMFSPSKANFSACVQHSEGLFVSQIYHSVHFEMNEEGTTSSAATASILTKSSRYVFRANRPFIFVITDDSDFVLFMGVIADPIS